MGGGPRPCVTQARGGRVRAAGGLFRSLVLTDGPLLTVRAARAARCRVAALCLECERVRELSLKGFAANRLGGTPLAELPLRCRCGSRAFRVSVAGRGAKA